MAGKDEEVFEIVDENGEVIGTAPRSECHGNPSLAHRAVHILVMNGQGNVYLQKRSSQKDIQPGKWDSSVGGHLLPGETYEVAARRELKEELGIDLEDTGGADTLLWRHDYVWETGVETEHIRMFLLRSEGPFQLDPSEIEEGRFWSVAELKLFQGKGTFTPNLEEELRLLGIFSKPGS